MRAARSKRRLTLPIARLADGRRPPSRFARRRAALLASVYVLMGLHIAHWKIAGRTLAPLELNEVMYTLELGVITAGFLFMAAACAATLIFGRFFCGWGCHMLALQDLCRYLLRKIGVRPRPVRSRVLLFVPLAAMCYMFVWPQLIRVADGRPPPAIHVRSDAEGWASFTTTNFWRNLPGPGIALLTFGICGFAIVYVLGSRSFCTYGCPYGAVFRGLDRGAPGRIVAAGDCAQCGLCTAACPSHIQVHEELRRFGTVVSAACLRDLECVSACPSGAVRFGWTLPPLLRAPSAWRPIRKPFDFSRSEELLLGAVLVAVLLAFRGLYDVVPFLLTLGLGAIVAYAAVILWRCLRRSDVFLRRVALRAAGRLTAAGVAYCVAWAAFAAFWSHSAMIRWHEFFGYRAAQMVLQSERTPGDPGPIGVAIARLDVCRRWGLVVPQRLGETLGKLYALRGASRAETGDFRSAAADLRLAAALRPLDSGVQYDLGVVLAASGRPQEAIRAYRAALAANPTDADTHNNLGLMLAQRGESDAAEQHLRAAIRSEPRHAHAQFNLGRLLAADGRGELAREHFQAAARLSPDYAALLAAQPAAPRSAKDPP